MTDAHPHGGNGRHPRALMCMSCLCLAAAGCASLPRQEARPPCVNVLDFGAMQDGVADATPAFQRALDAAAAAGGVVCVPTGKYRFDGVLDIPANVCLEGVWRAPVRGEPPDRHGSVLLACAGKGDADGTPFLTMNENSLLKGVTIFYPEQVRADPPVPYPWTVRGNGKDNIAILDVTMVNPYQAVDLGTKACGRHLVRNLHAYPLFRGLYVNQCYDVGRLENIHFWPFWDIDPNSPLWEFTKQHATAFILGKTDGEMAVGLFCIFYHVGMHFIDGPVYDAKGNLTGYAGGSGMYTNCYLDVSPCAVKADAVMDTAGVCFVNGSIMSRVAVGPKNRGPVKFVGCGFWATRDLASHATLAGRGSVIFDACQFNDWDRAERGAPCIDANNSRLIVSACDFPATRDGCQVLRLGPRVRSAVIMGNTMPGGVNIVNDAPPQADIQMGLNAAGPKPNYIVEWLALGPFSNPETPGAAPPRPCRAGIDIDYLEALGGEKGAVLTPDARVAYTDGDGATRRATVRVLRADDRHCLDFHALYEEDRRVAYAFAYVYSDRTQTAGFDAGFNDGGKVFVNGMEAYRRFTPQGAQCVPGLDLFEAELEPGWNRVLVKVEDGGGARWEFTFEAYGEDGAPLRSATELPE